MRPAPASVEKLPKFKTMESEIKLGNPPREEVRNNTTLRHDLQDCYNQLRRGEIGKREADTYANLAGKMVSSAKAQLDYNVTVGSPDRKIDFFED